MRIVDYRFPELWGGIAKRFRVLEWRVKGEAIGDHKEFQLVVFGARISRLGEFLLDV